jgi:hypothetical protein
MALRIYPAAAPDNPYSQGATMTNPLRLGFNGREAGISEVRYYLRNDDATYDYTSITIQPIDQSGRDITDGTNDFAWKLSAGNTQPTSDEWDAITPGAAISMSDITDISTYLPFWLRIEIPRGASVMSYDDAVLRIAATET